jgi:hypothetical protein
MSWLFSQALVAEYSAANSLDGEQSAPLSGSRIQQAYCAPDKMTDFSRLSRFGMTYKPLTDIPGEELSMSSVVAFHVRTLVPQEKAQELTENEAGCGEKWHASFAKYDPNLFLWKTPQCSLFGDSEEFLETWPQWGLMRDGECWEQRTLEQSIRGIGCGSLERIPTPQARDWKGSSGRSMKGLEHDLPTHAKKFPTPQASDHRDRGNMSNPSVQRRVDIGKQISLSQSVHPTSGQLNPTWVEWLMGWPLGWTDLKPLEMDKSHCVQQQPGES